jgi:isoamyl acetate esterase
LSRNDHHQRRSALLIGDSIRMHYQSHVQKALAGEIDVMAVRENCQSSRNVLEHLDEWLDEACPTAVHINCGLHDLRRDPGASGPGVPLAEYETNVAAILRRIRTRGIAAVWATTTPVIEERHTAMKLSRRHAADVIAYNDAALRQAAAARTEVNDLHAAIERGGIERMIGPDGVHLTAEGSRRAAEEVVAWIRRLFL